MVYASARLLLRVHLQDEFLDERTRLANCLAGVVFAALKPQTLRWISHYQKHQLSLPMTVFGLYLLVPG
ncbi:hypothetical protein VB735_07040 [Halotia wernerae UHCC 0503]|nr:hypothetical protein [Halotia wernerae UHCC 0503]